MMPPFKQLKKKKASLQSVGFGQTVKERWGVGRCDGKHLEKAVGEGGD